MQTQMKTLEIIIVKFSYKVKILQLVLYEDGDAKGGRIDWNWSWLQSCAPDAANNIVKKKRKSHTHVVTHRYQCGQEVLQ